MMLDFVTFGLYLLLMFGIGMYFYFRTNNVSDFILGGRQLGPIPSAISAGASDMSGWLLMGLPASALVGGMTAFWICFGLFLGTFLNWQLIAPRLREESELLDDSLTVPTFLERKLHDPTGFLRIALSIAILFFFTFYTSSGFVAGGKLFNSLFGMDYHTAIVAGAAVVLTYTFLGGYLAVSWTDVVQGLLMITAIAIVPVLAIQELGGVEATFNRLHEISPNHLNIFQKPDGTAMNALTIASLMAWGLGYFGQPHILARFMGIRDVKSVTSAKWIATAWSGIVMTLSVGVGLIGFVYFYDAPLADSEQVFIQMIKVLTHPLITGLFLAAVMAAIMSTADSQLLVASAALTSDLLGKYLTPKQSLLLSRITVGAIAMIALILAWDENSKVLDIVSYAWAGLGASCGVVMLIALWWKKATWHGAIAGALTGAVVTVIWNKLKGGIFELYELLPAFILAALAMFVVSLFTQQDTSEYTENR
ncbi:sodium/proline symporter PutP [Suttonella ornithocola]|uniref:Sodium/proline symporter n=1 Tax=Suttonella ornithocola TaxID=279832 RepID=A0A380MQJ3_9GAMM|nr:sodium/proline symporter PutP [Suttonella ornithocola]SUO94336.1 Proline permease [Suttonella ornithocola]